VWWDSRTECIFTLLETRPDWHTLLETVRDERSLRGEGDHGNWDETLSHLQMHTHIPTQPLPLIFPTVYIKEGCKCSRKWNNGSTTLFYTTHPLNYAHEKPWGKKASQHRPLCICSKNSFILYVKSCVYCLTTTITHIPDVCQDTAMQLLRLKSVTLVTCKSKPTWYSGLYLAQVSKSMGFSFVLPENLAGRFCTSKLNQWYLWQC